MKTSLLLGFCLCAVGIAAGDLKLGTAAVVITPPLKTPMAGYYYERGAEGVHDDLFAKAMVLEAGGTRVALVQLDLISTARGFVDEARRLIERETGIPGTNVMISATHSHTGPVFANTSARYDSQGGANDLATSYTTRLPSLIAQTVTQAAGQLKEVNAFHGAGHEENLAYNRRFFMKDGTIGWNPGKLNPAIIRPAGPIDPEAPVVLFTTSQNEPVACYANFTIHLDTVGGMFFSADAPGVLAQLLAEAHGPNFFTLYTTGACGDINHINVKSRRAQKGHAEAARIGTILAANYLATLDKELRAVTNETLRVRSKMVKLPLPEITEDEVAKARDTVKRSSAAAQTGGSRTKFLDLVDAFKVLEVYGRSGMPHEVEVQVIALGDEVAWVSLPGEIFVRLGLDIKERSPFPRTIIAELSNGSVGYVPDRAAYPQGNYEVISARCATGSGELLVDAALRMLAELHQEALRP